MGCAAAASGRQALDLPLLLYDVSCHTVTRALVLWQNHGLLNKFSGSSSRQACLLLAGSWASMVANHLLCVGTE
jgi:Fe2+ or Zn2+ uptake regulation protein